MYYSNGFESTFEELISHYPAFYREVFEMKAILEAQGSSLDIAVMNINKVIENTFIDTADAETIGKLERFLRLETDPRSSLDDRRKIVKSHFGGFGKVSSTVLKNIISSYTNGDVKISFSPADEAGNNLLDIEVERGTTENFSALEIIKTIKRRLPAHIWFGVNVTHKQTANLNTGMLTVLLRECKMGTETEIIIFTYIVDEHDDVLVDEHGNIFID